MPKPNYDDWQDEYGDVFEDVPASRDAPVPPPEPPPEHEDFISTDWSKLRTATNGDLADEEWMGGPTPTDSGLLPKCSDWQRLGLFALAIAAVLALGVAGVVLLWPSPAPARLAGVVTGTAQTLFAPAEGKISRVLVTQGALVSRGAPLFEITGGGADPAARTDASARLANDRARAERLTQVIQELDSLLAASRQRPATPASLRDAEQMRQRQHDLRDEQRDNDAEIAQLERSIAAGAPSPTRTILAEQQAVIRRLPVVVGQDVVPGLPLAELVNCDKLSVTADAATAASQGLVSGRALRIRLDGSQTAIEAEVPSYALRNGTNPGADRSAGLAAPGQLAVPVDKATVERIAGEACPIGRRALIEAD